jgi:2-polyprenyl-3-methyl-5-hydroxy-6-metoxy-1,4-benzoquinol methylase
MTSDAWRYYNETYAEFARRDDAAASVEKIAAVFPPLPRGAKVLDLGAGHGSIAGELVRRGYEVHAVEISEEALAALRSRGVHAMAGDVTQPVPTTETFDAVLLLDVLEHVFDPVQVLVNAKRVLAPGGSIVLTVPLYFDVVDRLRILLTGSIVSYDNLVYGLDAYRRFRSYTYDHVRFFRAVDVPEMLSAAGLRVEAREFGPLVGLRRLPRPLRWLLGHPSVIAARPSLLAHSVAVRARA